MKLKIATWNLERPRVTSAKKNSRIIEALHEIDADILVLTETNSIINPGTDYKQISTKALSVSDGVYYGEGEIRTSIWTKCSIVHHVDTYDSNTSICARIATEFGALDVYGTVIGVFGNRRPSFIQDLRKQLVDWRQIAKTGNLCVAGDFNLTFADPYYYTKEGRQLVADCFRELKISNTTLEIPRNIDHIAISKSFLGNAEPKIGVWNGNKDKKLSDHNGVWVLIEV